RGLHAGVRAGPGADLQRLPERAGARARAAAGQRRGGAPPPLPQGPARPPATRSRSLLPRLRGRGRELLRRRAREPRTEAAVRRPLRHLEPLLDRPAASRGALRSAGPGPEKAMGIERVKTLGVVGAGQMGRGIAQVACLADLGVVLHDRDEAILGDAAGAIDRGLTRLVEKGTLSQA